MPRNDFSNWLKSLTRQHGSGFEARGLDPHGHGYYSRRLRIEPLEERKLLSINFAGVYSQNFNTLLSSGIALVWSNDSTLAGWSLFRQPAPGTAITSFDASDGASTAGSFSSFGTLSATDRALGGLGSGGTYFGSPLTGNVAGWITVALTNSTGSSINTVDLSFTGEQWQDGGNSTAAAQTMTMEYGIGSSFASVTTWTAPGGNFNFTSPVHTTVAAALDGNFAANRTAGLGGSLTGLSWANGNTLWVRWIDNNDTGIDHALAIDDFSARIHNWTVNTLADENDGIAVGGVSLRDAIAAAVAGEMITFDPSLTAGGPGTIALTHGELKLSKAVTIDATGLANVITIDAQQQSRVFNIDAGGGDTSGDFTIKGLKLTGGRTTGNGANIEDTQFDGGGVRSVTNGILRLTNVTVNSNRTEGRYARGGGVYAQGDVELLNSFVTNNLTQGRSSDGGGITALGSVTLSNTTVSGNSTQGNFADGGGIFSKSGVTLTNSNVNANSTHGIQARGGGIASFGNVSLTNSSVNQNTATGNNASGGGVAMLDDDYGGPVGVTIALSHSTVSGNQVTGDYDPNYAGLYHDDDADNQSYGGHVVIGGGAIFSLGQSMTVNDSTINANSTHGTYAAGGGIFASGSLNAQNSSFTNNFTQGKLADGGGIAATGNVTLNESTVSGNSTQGNFSDGGGVFSRGLTTLTGSSVTGNSTHGVGADGGGLFAAWGASLTNSSVSQNTVSGNNANGGGISTDDDYGGYIAVALTHSSVSGNQVTGDYDAFYGNAYHEDDYGGGGVNGIAVVGGGGIFSHSGVNLTDSTVADNSTFGPSIATLAATGEGGGIFAVGGSGSVFATGSTISGNSTHGQAAHGGGISVLSFGFFSYVNLLNSTISGNTVFGADARGGGTNSGLLSSYLSTITDNHSNAATGTAGGAYIGLPSTIVDSIIAGNSAAGGNPDLKLAFSDNTINYSLIGNKAGTTLTEAQTPDSHGNLIGSSTGLGIINPRLGPLANNGGPTRTHGLLAGSPAIDKGRTIVVGGFDQRGEPFARMIDGDAVPGARLDMGAFELQPVPNAFYGDYNVNHVVDTGDFVLWRKTVGTTGVTPYSKADGDGDTTIDQDDYGVWRTNYGNAAPASGAGIELAADSPQLPQTMAADAASSGASQLITVVNERRPTVVPAGTLLQPTTPAISGGATGFWEISLRGAEANRARDLALAAWPEWFRTIATSSRSQWSDDELPSRLTETDDDGVADDVEGLSQALEHEPLAALQSLI